MNSKSSAQNTGKKISESDLRSKLTPLQFKVTQEEGTEPPFKNEYWDNKKAGIYVDVVSGEPLFASSDKYDSGTGWPSFTKPIKTDSVTLRTDRHLFVSRTEVRSAGANSHLGHVFDDGPAPTGKRFCMNSAALRFVPVEKLQAEGYGDLLTLFPGQISGQTATDAKPVAVKANLETAYLAGGCFWGMEDIIRKIPGVVDIKVGYTGGSAADPNYQTVKAGASGHAESVKVIFDPAKLSYHDLLGYFFRLHDPTTLNRQGNDVGSQYRSAVFYLSEEQRKTAEEVRKEVDVSGKWKKPIVTEITAAGQFFDAEEYHQDYLVKHPGGYTCHYLRD